MKKENDILYKAIQNSLSAGTQEICTTFETMDWKNIAVYGNWLAQTYYYVCHSTRLLAAAAARFTVKYDKEHIQMIDHAKEERMHEKIAIHDLQALGLNIKDFPELPQTKSLYHSMYSLIERENPMAMFGYILLLETLSLAKGHDIKNYAQKNFGLKSTAYLKLHTEDDVEHLKSYEKIIMESTEINKMDIKNAVELTTSNYKSMLVAINDIAKSTKEKLAA